MRKELMLGNEAIARGAYEAGVRVVSSYPGTPSTEITAAVSKYEEINAEWAPNEKVALEVAVGASVAGARAMSCMKHVGLNVAADPLFTASYTGVRGGLVIVVADDPSMFSSQNEQDSRYYARSAHVPVLEPADAQECKDFVKLAFELSEQYDTPVMVRLTTRISHVRSIVALDDRAEVPLIPYEKQPQKYVMIPGYARARHVIVEARDNVIRKDASTMTINRAEYRDPSLGIVCSGPCYQYVREAAPDASVFKLGLTYPLPEDALRAFADKVQKVVVVEELEPFFEDALRAIGIPVSGKDKTGLQGEMSVRRLRKALFGVEEPLKPAQDTVVRPPALCPGCPHRPAYQIIKKLNLTVFGDIGCYTLGALPPFSAMDTTLCMGAAIGMAFGAEKAFGHARDQIAVIGDSTFIHGGITPLIDAVYNGGSITVVILDNRTTGMTGHQHNPTSGKDIYGEDAPEIDLAALCGACGVQHVLTINPYDQKALEDALREETARKAVSVLIVKAPCILLEKKWPAAMQVREKDCRACGLCMRAGCPALRKGNEGIKIEPSLCTGCGYCAGACPFKCIERGAER